MTLVLAPAAGLERRIARRLHDDDAYRLISTALADIAIRAIHPPSLDGHAGPAAMGLLKDPVAGATRAANTRRSSMSSATSSTDCRPAWSPPDRGATAARTSGSSDRSLEPTGRKDGAYPDVVTETLVPERDIVSWSDLEVLVRRLAERIRTTDVDVMLAITRAGSCRPGCWRIAWACGTSSSRRSSTTTTHGLPGPHPTFLQFPADPLLRGQRVLIVDEVWDSGTTIAAVTDRVRQAGGIPTTAVLHYKPTHSVVEGEPDVFAVETDAGSSTRSSSGTDGSPDPPGAWPAQPMVSRRPTRSGASRRTRRPGPAARG